jgi:hypothetical protein
MDLSASLSCLRLEPGDLVLQQGASRREDRAAARLARRVSRCGRTLNVRFGAARTETSRRAGWDSGAVGIARAAVNRIRERDDPHGAARVSCVCRIGSPFAAADGTCNVPPRGGRAGRRAPGSDKCRSLLCALSLTGCDGRGSPVAGGRLKCGAREVTSGERSRSPVTRLCAAAPI